MQGASILLYRGWIVRHVLLQSIMKRDFKLLLDGIKFASSSAVFPKLINSLLVFRLQSLPVFQSKTRRRFSHGC